MHGKKILLIDDDSTLLRLLQYTFDGEGAEVTTARNGLEGLRAFYSARPDLVVLDVSMPEMDGWTACKSMRQMANVPILMLTARSQEHEIVRGLEMGADHYITKPFSIDVVLAHARAMLRRACMTQTSEHKIAYADPWLSVDLTERRVIVNGEPVKLTATEYRLLEYLVENSGRVLTFQQILSQVWGWEYQDEFHQVRLYIWRVRQKIERDPKAPRYILGEYGVGYRFERQLDAE